MEEHFSELSTDCQIAIVKVAAVGRACRADVEQFCGDVQPGQNAKAECLKSHQRWLQGRAGEGAIRRTSRFDSERGSPCLATWSTAGIDWRCHAN